MRAWLFVFRRAPRQAFRRRAENNATHEYRKKTSLDGSIGGSWNDREERDRLYWEHPALASGASRPELSECGILWQSGMVQSRRLREGLTGAGNDSRARKLGAIEAGPDHSGRDERKYRNRVCHDCSGAW